MTKASQSIRRFIPPLLFDAPDFRRLWFGQTISVFGDQITQLGLPLVAVLTLGADATQMGTLTAVGLFPHLLFSLPAGVWLDRVRARRRLMIAADIGRAALITSIPVAEPAMAIAISRSPPLNPPTRASIDAWVPVSVRVTTLTCGKPASLPRASLGPPNARRLASVSGTSSKKPSTAARRNPR